MAEVKEVVESVMRVDDETTVKQLLEWLLSEGMSLSKSIVHVLRCRESLGWIDSEGKCLLSNDMQSEQNEASGMGNEIFTRGCGRLS